MCGNIKRSSWLCVMLFLPHIFCHTMEDAKRLLSDKLSDYEKTFRPLVNQSSPVTLYTALELVSIQEFDEVQEKLTVTGIVVLNWLDEYMKWNPDNYGGMTQLVIESDKVWTPSLVLTNNVEKLEKIGDAWQVIRFTSDGISYYYPGNVFSASCKVDVTYYPWDRHRCGFSFSVWAHAETEVVFVPSEDNVLTTYFSENGAWTFYDSSVETALAGAYLEFNLFLERKPRFVFVNVILPIIFMAFLNTMIFVIPVECGERISYSITMLLALAVFLTLVGDNLPKTSSPMSVFSYYLLTVLMVSICITLATIFNLRLYYADDSKPVKGCLASFARCMKCDCRGQRHKMKQKYKRNSDKNNGNIYGNKKTHHNGNLFEHFVSSGYEGSYSSDKTISLPAINRNIYLPERNRRRYSTEEERDSGSSQKKEDFDTITDVSSKDVSAAFDKFFFALSVITLMTATFVLFLFLLLSNRRT